MRQKNYYVVLGIPRNESPAGIRAAYRKMAKRLHPDVTGNQGAAPFQEINEAYEVLSDPERRDQHDRAIGAEAPVKRAGPRSGPPADIEVILSRTEAFHGCRVPIALAVIPELVGAQLKIPPRMRAGTVDVALDPVGLPHRFLRVQVSISNEI